ncbi:hypothetical protein ACIOGT_32385 [Streptomyces microflavus]|uniref:hypothetical protein n=1 Tax=Streptomyces microflavus TaxID=1919 RepID=UPI00381D58CF
MDRQPGAERLYGRFLHQSLVEERRKYGLDMNVMARVLALLSEATKGTDPAPYVLKHGEVRVDRVLGGMWWGQHDCPDRPGDADL